MKTILEEEKNHFWFSYLNSKIPQDLQSLYSEDITKMKASFEAGVRFAISFYSQHPNNLTLNHDR